MSAPDDGDDDDWCGYCGRDASDSTDCVLSYNWPLQCLGILNIKRERDTLFVALNQIAARLNVSTRLDSETQRAMRDEVNAALEIVKKV